MLWLAVYAFGTLITKSKAVKLLTFYNMLCSFHMHLLEHSQQTWKGNVKS